MPTLVMDLDGTLTIDDPRTPYAARLPNLAVVEKLRQYKAAGFEIAIYTARNMRTHDKSVGRINALTIPIVIDWLKRHDIPFDELHVGKPWAGAEGFYVDDRAVRPQEFTTLSHAEILKLLDAHSDGYDGQTMSGSEE
jgi:capsule biosynthesis phosphatase